MGASTISKLAVMLTGGLDPTFAATMKKGDEQLSALKRSAKQAGDAMGSDKGAGSFKDSLKSLNDQLGRGSSLGQLGKLLRGSGALFAVSLISKEIAGAAAEASKLVTQFRQGKLTGAEMADQVARQIPILGNIYAAGRSIREIWDGQATTIEKMKIDQEIFNAALEAGKEIMKTMREDAEKTADFIARMKQEMLGSFGFKVPLGDQQAKAMKESSEQYLATKEKLDDSIAKAFGKDSAFARQWGEQGINSIEEMKRRVKQLKAIMAQQIPAAQTKSVMSGGVLWPASPKNVVMNQDEIDKAREGRDAAQQELAALNNIQLFKRSMADEFDAQIGKALRDFAARGRFLAEWGKAGAESGAAYVEGVAKKIDSENKRLGLFRQTNPFDLLGNAGTKALGIFERIGNQIDIIKGRLGVAGNKLLLAIAPAAGAIEDRFGVSERMRQLQEWDESHRLAPAAERGSQEDSHLVAQAISRATNFGSTDPVVNNTAKIVENTAAAARALAAMERRNNQPWKLASIP